MKTNQVSFGDAVVAWQKTHGRHDLPWQNTKDPYKVWLSEIMLQQTQVVTVRDYFGRFLERFPTVSSLAAAHQDDVLALWSGLGYYSRARNMHRAAQDVVALHGGEFPKSAALLQTLPGIGRSTAAAVASICFGEAIAILDGNVKRVLCRYLGFAEDLSSAKNEKTLWQIAQTMLPTQGGNRDVKNAMPIYTQGVMDLGATVCTPKKPQCDQCPLRKQCVALAQSKVDSYPVKTKKLKRTSEQLWVLLVQTSDSETCLVQRPQTGVWAGLFCLPVFGTFAELQSTVPAKYRDQLHEGVVLKHVLTHKDFYLHPVALTVRRSFKFDQAQWFTREQWTGLGLPSPIRKMLEEV
jgi:A/G-specific adenine glycosylase